jgi:hypothetical protein
MPVAFMIRVRTPEGASLSSEQLAAVAYRLEREGAQVCDISDGSLDGHFSEFTRASVVLLALLRSFKSQNPSFMAAAVTQAVLTKGVSGKLALSGRTLATLASLVNLAPDGGLLGTQQLYTMVSLEARDYLSLFQSFRPGSAHAISPELATVYTVSFAGSQQVLAAVAPDLSQRRHAMNETNSWVPPPGTARDAIVTATQRALAEVIGPMAQVITDKAISKSGTLDELVINCTSMVPASQRDPVRKKLDLALFGRAIHH